MEQQQIVSAEDEFNAIIDLFVKTLTRKMELEKELSEALKANNDLCKRIDQKDEEIADLKKKLHDHNGMCQKKLSEQLKDVLPVLQLNKEYLEALKESTDLLRIIALAQNPDEQWSEGKEWRQVLHKKCSSNESLIQKSQSKEQ
jgi:methyl-accepting chemotaxis protein